MNDSNKKNKSFGWQEILRYVLIAATIAFISLLFPSEAQFSYKYQKGRNWNYEELVAPFSFAINRSADEIEEEKESIEKEFVPIYVKDDNSLSKFDLSVDNLALGGLEDQIRVKDFLKKEAAIHYRKGVLGQDDYNQLWQNKKELVISQNNINTKIAVQSVGNPEKIQSLLEEELSLAFPDSIVRLVDFSKILIIPDLKFNKEINDKLLNDKLEKVSPVIGMVNKGEIIAGQGEVITDQMYSKLESYKTAYEKEVGAQTSVYFIFAGYLLLTLLIIGVLLLYLQFHAREVYEKWTRLSFILMWIAIFAYLVYVIEKQKR